MELINSVLKDKLNREPAVLIGSVGGFLVLIIELLPVLIPGIDGELVTALLKLAQAGIAVASVIFIRNGVYSPATFEGMKASQVAHLEKSAQ